jgi:hypothetical protein
MEISEDIQIADLGVYLTKENILVFSDFHLGYEEALNKQGILIPRHQFADTKRRLENLFSKIKNIKTIVITGDLKHEFGTISRQEWQDVSGIVELMQKHCEKLVILKGNHDTVLQSMLKNKNLRVEKDFCIGDYAILHGDELPQDPSVLKRKIFIIGHVHPAIKLTDSFTSEKVKCFLKGKWSGKTLIVLPSFNLITEGTDVLTEKVKSPFLQKDINNFEVWAVAGSEKALYFGQIKNLIS